MTSIDFLIKSIEETDKVEFQELLAAWYKQNSRDLPWRNTKSAYFIWLSEIILQQTQIVQGTAYYIRFIKRFSTIEKLAEAEEDEVLKYWQGLGYYSRARNLHFTAKKIVTEYKGVFPKAYNKVLDLKGVGNYTAAAICSFAFDLPYATVDGNVYRFLARLYGIALPIDSSKGKKGFEKLANFLLKKIDPALHNQAMMEMGAIVCTPTSPNCSFCPFVAKCFAKSENSYSSYPVKEKKIKVTKRYFSYFYIQKASSLFLVKRLNQDIWKNLYEFPMIETTQDKDLTEIVKMPIFKQWGLELNQISSLLFKQKHVLSHQHIFASFYEITVFDDLLIKDAILIPFSELKKYPIPRLIHLFLEKLKPELL